MLLQGVLSTLLRTNALTLHSSLQAFPGSFDSPSLRVAELGLAQDDRLVGCYVINPKKRVGRMSERSGHAGCYLVTHSLLVGCCIGLCLLALLGFVMEEFLVDVNPELVDQSPRRSVSQGDRGAAHGKAEAPVALRVINVR